MILGCNINSTMRIIAGKKRGMKLLSPKSDVSRPITDRVKESLFSVLYSYDMPKGKIVADLFCGVGSLGIESLSRGAEFVTFVEKDPKVILVLKKNIDKADFGDVSKVVRTDAFKIGAPVGQQRYDLIFVDPPYAATKNVDNDSALSELLTLVNNQLADGGIVVVRTHRGTELLEYYGQLRIIERRQWGTMAVTILGQKDT
ncbi:MAG: 16S rRNA (guanine(966)-N(2))-methyltransferase RsmD [Sedimentisphaerales bacterium]|jgi:16S rRNA (guanine966-N2)-methyltransferase|nr:16S rRNA (guanine(966)-N(2))-methyltransferase RsmD [Sedimentisphaerales bacterium]